MERNRLGGQPDLDFWSCYLLNVCLWPNYLAFLSLIFLMRKTELCLGNTSPILKFSSCWGSSGRDVFPTFLYLFNHSVPREAKWPIWVNWVRKMAPIPHSPSWQWTLLCCKSFLDSPSLGRPALVQHPSDSMGSVKEAFLSPTNLKSSDFAFYSKKSDVCLLFSPVFLRLFRT